MASTGMWKCPYGNHSWLEQKWKTGTGQTVCILHHMYHSYCTCTCTCTFTCIYKQPLPFTDHTISCTHTVIYIYTCTLAALAHRPGPQPTAWAPARHDIRQAWQNSCWHFTCDRGNRHNSTSGPSAMHPPSSFDGTTWGIDMPAGVILYHWTASDILLPDISIYSYIHEYP